MRSLLGLWRGAGPGRQVILLLGEEAGQAAYEYGLARPCAAVGRHGPRIHLQTHTLTHTPPHNYSSIGAATLSMDTGSLGSFSNVLTFEGVLDLVLWPDEKCKHVISDLSYSCPGDDPLREPLPHVMTPPHLHARRPVGPQCLAFVCCPEDTRLGTCVVS
jgi:hypothetical protein